MFKKEPNSTNVNIMKFLIHFNRKKNKKNKKRIPKKFFIVDNYSVLTHIMLIMLIYEIKPFEKKYFSVSNCDF